MANRAWKYWEPKFQADKVCDMNPVWPWGGHRRFAYDLVRWMRPARIAELGVHWGTSFFTFAQAMKDGRMKGTELIGVDTFEGEDHAGKYGPEVLATVRKIVKASFPNQSITLHQMFFADALPLVADGSVDLIHIDGLHTYEAVKEDFETWLPKLAPDGVMLFHDVAPDTGYGSTDYWEELRGTYPGFAFEHSWGLGVLFPKGEAKLAALQQDGLADKLLAYPAIARAERADIENRDLARMAKDRMETIQKQSGVNKELRERLDGLRRTTVPKEAFNRVVSRAESAERLAAERHDTIKMQVEKVRAGNGALQRRSVELETARKLAKERYDIIQQQGEKVRQRDETIVGLRRQLKGVQETVVRLEKRASVAETARDELRQRVQGLNERLSKIDERLGMVLERETKSREANAKRDATIVQLQQRLAAASKAERATQDTLTDLATHLAALATSHTKDRQAAQARFETLSEAIERFRAANEEAVRVIRQRLGRLDVDADLQSMRAEHLESIVAEHRERFDKLTHGETPEIDWLTGDRVR